MGRQRESEETRRFPSGEHPDFDLPPLPAEEAAVVAVQHETRRLFEDAARRIRYLDFKDLTLVRFKTLVFLVMLDRATDDTDEEIARKIKVEPDQVPILRDDPTTKAIRHRFEEELEELGRPRTFSEHVEDVQTQDRLARQLIADAVTNPDGRTRAIASKTLADRSMAPKRETQEVRHVFVRGEDLKRLTETERQMLEAGDIDAEYEVVDDDG